MSVCVWCVSESNSVYIVIVSLYTTILIVYIAILSLYISQ